MVRVQVCICILCVYTYVHKLYYINVCMYIHINYTISIYTYSTYSAWRTLGVRVQATMRSGSQMLEFMKPRRTLRPTLPPDIKSISEALSY